MTCGPFLRFLDLLLVGSVCVAALAVRQAATSGEILQGSGGEINGRVIAADQQTRGIAGAVVSFRRDGQLVSAVATDRTGGFALKQLMPGRYTVEAWKPGYLRQTYGATRVGALGTPIVLTEGQAVSVAIAIFRGAVLSGRLTDASGQPESGVTVGAYRVQPSGAPSLQGKAVETDDLGSYRITGLPPGRYVIKADAPLMGLDRDIAKPTEADIDRTLTRLAGGESRAMLAHSNRPIGATARNRTVTYAPIYFPGASAFEAAERVSVSTGQLRDGLDFEFVPVSNVEITGFVSGPVGSLAGIQLTLDSSDARSTGFHRSSETGMNGAFVFDSIPPGRYTLRARAPAGRGPLAEPHRPSLSVRTPSADAAQTASTQFLYAAVDLAVREQDVSGVTLTLDRGAMLRGRVVLESARAGSPELVRGIRVGLYPRESAAPAVLIGAGDFSTAREATVQADGTFAIYGISPGTYTLRVQGSARMKGSSFWLRSAAHEGRDLLDDDLTLATGDSLTGIIITFTDRHTELSGRLVLPSGQPSDALTVVVFPANQDWWRPTSRRVWVTHPATDGAFSIRDPPPGEYIVVAVHDLDDNALATGTLFAELAPSGVSVTVHEAEQVKMGDVQIRQ